jgi:hypothetical protein
MLSRAFIFAIFLSISACRTTPIGEQPLSRPLLSASVLNGDRSVTQVVHGAFGSRDMTLNCVVTTRGDSVTVIGLTAMGVRLFTLKHESGAVQVEKHMPIPEQLTPERLLADFQLVYWPLSALKAPLERAGWRISEPYSRTRRLYRGDRLIAEVHYESNDPWHGRVWLVNLEYEYTLGIDSTPVDAR